MSSIGKHCLRSVHVGLLACLVLFLPLISCANTLAGLKWESKADLFVFSIETSKPVRHIVTNRVENDGFFQLDFTGLSESYEGREMTVHDARVDRILLQSLTEEGVTRLTFYPARGIEWRIQPGDRPTVLNVEFRGTVSAAASPAPVSARPPERVSAPAGTPAPAVPPARETKSAPAIQDAAKEGRKTIIIDPGHGGYNNGCRNFWKIDGKYHDEKDLTLSYARKLKYLIDRSPNLRAVMTRDGDNFISLRDRVEFSWKHGGDLFVSIHMNASPGKSSASARGVELYYWKESGSDNAAQSYLEKLENDEMLPRLPGAENRHLKEVLSDLMKNALEEQTALSRVLCQEMWNAFQKSSYFKTYHRTPPIKSARFMVLANYDMPSILIEVGFLTHKVEGRYLVSDSFAWTSARVMYNGIQRFLAGQDPSFKPHYVDF